MSGKDQFVKPKYGEKNPPLYYLSYDVDEKCRHTVLGFANSSVTANFFFFIINSGSEAILS
jgi:hypothetical protein